MPMGMGWNEWKDRVSTPRLPANQAPEWSMAHMMGSDYEGDDPEVEDEDSEALPTYRDGKVHVMAEKCKTCIFNPVSTRIQGLAPGRVAGMVQDAQSDPAGSITCHNTLGGPNAICRGFYDLPDTPPIIHLAQEMGVIKFQEA